MSMVNKLFTIATALLATAFAVAHDNPAHVRPRVSDLGLKVGILPSGPLDAITDVAGVEVGSTTIIRGDNIRTGVTAVLPHSVLRDRVLDRAAGAGPRQ
jgi:D-aminopeptidase